MAPAAPATARAPAVPRARKWPATRPAPCRMPPTADSAKSDGCVERGGERAVETGAQRAERGCGAQAACAELQPHWRRRGRRWRRRLPQRARP